MNGITFNGKHNSTIEGLMYISSSPFVIPETKDTFVEIPFRDSAYLIPDASKRDIEVTVNFTLKADSFAELFLKFNEVSGWLTTAKRERLIFDELPNHYFMAKVVGEIRLEQPEDFSEVGDFVIRFRCEPTLYGVSSP